MLQLMLTQTSKVLLDRYILRMVGPVIRIANYPLLPRQKIRIIELLISILNQKLNISAYTPQMLSVCLRLLQEYKLNNDLTYWVSELYYSLIESTANKK